LYGAAPRALVARGVAAFRGWLDLVIGGETPLMIFVGKSQRPLPQQIRMALKI
jgi:hypothetical protein